jgi:hypothetical protein
MLGAPLHDLAPAVGPAVQQDRARSLGDRLDQSTPSRQLTRHPPVVTTQSLTTSRTSFSSSTHRIGRSSIDVRTLYRLGDRADRLGDHAGASSNGLTIQSTISLLSFLYCRMFGRKPVSTLDQAGGMLFLKML